MSSAKPIDIIKDEKITIRINHLNSKLLSDRAKKLKIKKSKILRILIKKYLTDETIITKHDLDIDL